MRRGLVVVTVAAVTLAAPLQAARAEGVDDVPALTQEELAAAGAVRDLELTVRDLELRVDDLDATSTDGDETIVSLRSDVLFAFAKADLPPAASPRLRQLLAKAPEGARVSVWGHTDDVGGTASNLALSRARARAVAAAIGRTRPDLRLDARGFGESRPVAPNSSGGKDDAEGRAKNRRVEIRYAR